MQALPPGSFVHQSIKTPAALIQQAETDPVVLKRYQNALQSKTSPQALERLRRLSSGRLASPHILRVYYARSGGSWGYKIRRVPAGTAVFVDRDTHTPVLLSLCGNPIRALEAAQMTRLSRVQEWRPTESDAGLILETPILDYREDTTTTLAAPAPDLWTRANTVSVASLSPLSTASSDALPPPATEEPAPGGADPGAALTTLAYLIRLENVQVHAIVTHSPSVPEPPLPVFVVIAGVTVGAATRYSRRRRTDQGGKVVTFAVPSLGARFRPTHDAGRGRT